MEAAANDSRGLKASIPYRLKAAGIHLSLSAVVFLAALYLILVEWFPGFHFFVDGGWQGVRLMAAIDLVLGPLLTLVIFNPFKARKLIVFDLSCIGLAQIGALVWGFYAIHSQHPITVNYFEGTFYPVVAEPIKQEGGSIDDVRKLSDRTPALLYVGEVESEEERDRAALMELFGGVAEFEDPIRFREFAPNWDKVREGALDPDKRASEHAAFQHALPGFLAEYGGETEDYFYFVYFGRHEECTLAFSKDGNLLGAVGCAPY